MSAITGILCQLITGNVSGAGTDGDVYIGIGGREFFIDSSADDFERGSWREYILGRGPVEPNLPPGQVRILNSTANDPRVGYQLDTIDLSKSPVYVRFEPRGNSPDWNLGFAAVLVYRGEGSFIGAWMPPSGFDNLWLGRKSGKILYLTDFWRVDIKPVLDSLDLAAIRAGIAPRRTSEPAGV